MDHIHLMVRLDSKRMTGPKLLTLKNTRESLGENAEGKSSTQAARGKRHLNITTSARGTGGGVEVGEGVSEGHLPATARIMTPRELLPAAKSDLYHPPKYQNQIVNKLVEYPANALVNYELLSSPRFYQV